MALFDSVKKALNRPEPARAGDPPAAAAPRPAPEDIRPPEVKVLDLLPAYHNGSAPQLLDCREPAEWQQVRIPGSLHIPMNQIPARLAELDQGEEWVVVCAHGNRSLAVAGYLIANGFRASSLAGGVSDWWMRGGPTESDAR